MLIASMSTSLQANGQRGHAGRAAHPLLPVRYRVLAMAIAWLAGALTAVVAARVG